MEFSGIIQYIEKNISTPIRIQKLAMLSGQSLAVFTANFRKATGLPPKQYISIRRVNRAKQLLLSTNDPVKQISLDVGFPTSRLFYRLFKKYALGISGRFPQALPVERPECGLKPYLSNSFRIIAVFCVELSMFFFIPVLSSN